MTGSYTVGKRDRRTETFLTLRSLGRALRSNLHEGDKARKVQKTDRKVGLGMALERNI